jgi:hypothetical protein
MIHQFELKYNKQKKLYQLILILADYLINPIRGNLHNTYPLPLQEGEGAYYWFKNKKRYKNKNRKTTPCPPVPFM